MGDRVGGSQSSLCALLAGSEELSRAQEACIPAKAASDSGVALSLSGWVPHWYHGSYQLCVSKPPVRAE